MLRVRMTEALPGMVLALPVYHPDRKATLLLRPGVALDDTMIGRLRDVRTPEVFIRYPGLEQLAELINADVSEARADITGLIAEAFDDAAKRTDCTLSFRAYKDAVNALLERLSHKPSAALFIHELVDAGQPLLRHGSNVCFISLLMALKLEYYMIRERPKLPAPLARDVSPLGVAAMLHDIGMARIPEHTRDAWLRFRDENDPDWRAHVREGYDLVRGELEPAAAAAVLHHHQRFDGTGFPARHGSAGELIPLAGNRIHIFPRIIAAADLFERLRNPVSADGVAAPIPNVRALRMMREDPYRKWVDPVVFSALLSVVPAFPPGSVVTLSSGLRGAVCAWNPADPCRPTVLVIPSQLDVAARSARHGPALMNEPPPRTIDLALTPELSITEIDGVNVSADAFSPPTRVAFDVVATQKAMMNAAYDPAYRPAQRSA